MFDINNIFILLLIASPIIKSDIADNTVEADDSCDLPQALVEEIRAYGPIVDKIVNSVTEGVHKGKTYDELAEFVDKFGARQAGTQNLEDSIDYLLEKFPKYGLENVHGENVTIPHWVRGEESCEMILPRRASIAVLSLGSSISTPKEGIEAEVLVVRSFDELDTPDISKKVKGKIVVFNFHYVSYGVSVKYRSRGAARAAKYGAVATLIRSVTPFSMYSLHAGHQSYEDNIPKIPSASITVEDARMLQRVQNRGETIKIKLKIVTENLPDSVSRNVVAELKGNQLPQKAVIVSGHIDSWDVGVGAMDDGGGAFISWYSLIILKSLNLKPKRTLRAVLWTAEETGLDGFIGYNRTHAKELDDITFALESDEGTFTPLGIEYTAGKKGGCILQEIVNLLEAINTTRTKANDAVGSDISLWAGKIPTGALLNANAKYFWFHHSSSDTMDVINPEDLDKAAALWASVAYVIADLSEEFPRDFGNRKRI